MAKLRIEWPLCLDGYRIEKRAGRPAAITIASDIAPVTWTDGNTARDWIVAESKQFVTQTPLEVDGLWRRLADEEPTESGALHFVRIYGLFANKHQERLDSIIKGISEVRLLTEAIDNKDWEKLSGWMRKNWRKIRLHPFWDRSRERPDPDLFFAPATLIDAIYLQAFQDATNGTEFRSCDRPGCPEYFAVGPGTGRWRVNRGATYCSEKCQKAHYYMKQKERTKR